MLTFTTKLIFKERAPQSEHKTLSSWRTRATVSTGLHARRATGLALVEREESFTRAEPVARWSREEWAAYEAERSSAARFVLFLAGPRCSIQTGMY